MQIDHNGKSIRPTVGGNPTAVTSGSPPARDGIAQNTLFAFLVQLSTSVFTALLTIVLVRALEPEGYGLFALALSIGGLVLVPSDFGLSQSAARFVAERRGETASVADVLRTALRLKLVLSGAAAVALAALAGPIADAFDAPALDWPLRGIAIAVAGQSVMLFFTSAFVAQARVRSNLRIVFSEAVVEVGASLTLVLLGAGAAGAAYGRAVGYVFGALLGFAAMARFLGRRLLRGRLDRGLARKLIRYASALVVVDGAFTLFGALDAIVIGALLGPAAVGLYKAPSRLIVFLHYPGLAVASGVAPRLARNRDEPPDVKAFGAAIRLLILGQAVLVAPVVVWAEPIVILLLGEDYRGSIDVLRAFAPFIFLSGLAPLVSLGVNYLGEARRRVPIAIAIVLLNLVLLVVLVPRIGIVAGAIGASMSYGLYVPAHIWICRRLIGLPLRPVFTAIVQAALAATAMGIVLRALGTEELSLAAWLTGLVLGPLAYLAVLFGTRAVRPRDLRALRAGGFR